MSTEDDLQAQIRWYADQALENEHVARRLNQVCEKTLGLLDDFDQASSFEHAMSRIMSARQLLRKRHET